MSDEARCENCGQIAPVPYLHWDVTGRVYLCKRQSDEARAGGAYWARVAAERLAKKEEAEHPEYFPWDSMNEFHADCAPDECLCKEKRIEEVRETVRLAVEAGFGKAVLQREREGDGERLDAVENGRWDVEWWPEGRGDKPAHWLVMPNIEDFKIIGSGLTVREAIDNAIQGDAAMQGEGGEP